MSKRYFFLLAFLFWLAVPLSKAEALSFVQTSNFYLMQNVGLRSFNVAGINVSLGSLPLKIQRGYYAGLSLNMSRWCKGQIDICGQDKAKRDADCTSKKNLCLKNGKDQAAYCTGLEGTCKQDSASQLESCKYLYLTNNIRCWYLGVPAEKQCAGAQTQSCMLATGSSGTQDATTCNTTTGQWNWGECVANTPPPPPPPPTCTPSSPQTQTISCPAGQTGAITQQRTTSCPGPTWSEWSTTSNSCQTAPPGVCTSFTYSDWSACANGSQTRTVLTASPSGCEGGTPITTQSCSVACTSFTYSAWGACSNNTQTRTVTASSPTGCTGGSPVLSQTCTVPCTGTQPACGLGYVGSYSCVNGNWQNNCQVACTQPPPACASGWSGNYSCMLSGSGYVWMNTCVPPGPQLCYRGVAYHLVADATGATKAYVKCDGSGYMSNGQNCMLNDCGPYQPWNNYNSESSFKVYTDTIYSITIPNSCNPSFVYTQCSS